MTGGAGAGRPLVLTIGEPAGIGPELAALAFLRRHAAGVPPFYVVGDPALIGRRARAAGLGAVPLAAVAPEEAAAAFATSLPVVAGAAMSDAPGHPDPADAAAVIAAVERGVADVAAGAAAALVTGPVQKASLAAAGFPFAGHTDYLGVLARRHWPDAPAEPVMLLAAPDLMAVPVTVHIPLAEVPRRLTAAAIVAAGRVVARDLAARFGIARPRIAVAGLNPHAGEGGLLGAEDAAIVAPAVAALRAEGIDARGPLPADTLFHAEARRGYDVVLAMYHDQALIPVKTLAFDEAVNVTLGLPFVRTAPDHGTALDIAGRGLARPASLIAALKLAARLAAAGGHG